MISALIFDMDGVIVHSNPMHRAAWAQYTRRHGVEMTGAMQQRMYGKRNDEIIRGFLGEHLSDDEVFAHGAAKEAIYREMMQPRISESLVPGIREFLDRHRDLPMGIATNAEVANVDFVLDGAGLRGFFRVIVDGHQVTRPKPWPDIYVAAAQALGVSPADCIVFEDSHAGVAAGLAACMRVVGLATTHDDLSGVSLVIRDFHDRALEDWLACQSRSRTDEQG
ncbi:MAG TPA: HAD family phosphatase [Bryobacteraceae bacterium]|jgi:beta-phosphoglucomutase family hydrolase|nr:HAD family phosphatase [Bryobacteraceae bacterium]